MTCCHAVVYGSVQGALRRSWTCHGQDGTDAAHEGCGHAVVKMELVLRMEVARNAPSWLSVVCA
jgi:hypothetical protein